MNSSITSQSSPVQSSVMFGKNSGSFSIAAIGDLEPPVARPEREA